MNERLASLNSEAPYTWAHHTDVELLHNGSPTPDISIYLREYRTDEQGSILSAAFTPQEARELASALMQAADLAEFVPKILDQA